MSSNLQRSPSPSPQALVDAVSTKTGDINSQPTAASAYKT